MNINIDTEVVSIYNKFKAINTICDFNVINRSGRSQRFDVNHLFSSLTVADIPLHISFGIITSFVEKIFSQPDLFKENSNNEINSTVIKQFILECLKREFQSQSFLWAMKYEVMHKDSTKLSLLIKRPQGNILFDEEEVLINFICDLIEELYNKESVFNNMEINKERLQIWGRLFYDHFKIYNFQEVSKDELEQMIMGFCKFPPTHWWIVELYDQAFGNMELRLKEIEIKIQLKQLEKARIKLEEYLETISQVLCDHLEIGKDKFAVKTLFDSLFSDEPESKKVKKHLKSIGVNEDKFKFDCDILNQFMSRKIDISVLMNKHVEIIRRFEKTVEYIVIRKKAPLSFKEFQEKPEGMEKLRDFGDFIIQILEKTNNFTNLLRIGTLIIADVKNYQFNLHRFDKKYYIRSYLKDIDINQCVSIIKEMKRNDYRLGIIFLNIENPISEAVVKRAIDAFQEDKIFLTFITNKEIIDIVDEKLDIFFHIKSTLDIYFKDVNLVMGAQQNIESLLNQGECDTIEFKSSMRWDKIQNKLNKTLPFEIVKEIAAFLNSRGGTLLIGVDDDGSICGIENDFKTLKKKDQDGFLDALSTLIIENLGADVTDYIESLILEYQNKLICRVKVKRSKEPIYSKKDQEFIIRAGSRTKSMTPKETVNYIKTHWSI